MALNPKQRRFVVEFLKDQNATKAAARAGYSKKSADTLGARLASQPDIKAAIDAALKEAQGEAIVTVEYVLRGLKEVAERCLQRSPVMEFDRIEKCMVQKKIENEEGQEVGVYEFDSAGANRAFELLGKHLKVFDDLSQFATAPLVINIVPATQPRDTGH